MPHGHHANAIRRPGCAPRGGGRAAARRAADAFFGAALGELVERFDREWQAAVVDWWRSRYEHVRGAREKVEAYKRRGPGELTDEELLEYARLSEDLDGLEQAMPLVATGQEPMHVLGVVRRSRMFRFERSDADRRLIDQLAGETPLEAEVLFVALNSETRWLTKKLKKVPGSRVK